MKKSSFLNLTLFGLLSLAACDQLQEDIVPESEDVLQFSSTQKNLFINPGGEVIMNLESNFKLSSSAQLQVGKQPERGGLEFLEGGLLRYAANKDFTSGRDYFVLEMLKETAVMDSDTIHIVIPSDITQYPCSSGAQADEYFIPYDSTYRIRREIDILANDYHCDSLAIGLSFFTTPKHGTAEIVDNYLYYTPGDSFTSYDEFMYQLCEVTEGDSLHCTLASVNISIIKGPYQECDDKLVAENDDFPIILSDSEKSGSDSITRTFDVFLNDTICGPLKDYYISIPPDLGSATMENDLLYYTFPRDYVVGLDSLSYTICQTGALCDEAKVYIEIK